MTQVDRGPEYREKVERIKRGMAAAAGRRDPIAHVMQIEGRWYVKRNGYPSEEEAFETMEEARAFARTIPGMTEITVQDESSRILSREPV